MSWENVNRWYDRVVGKDGHYYHQNIIIPRLLRLLVPATHVLDVGCGQGVLARKLPEKVEYTGLDISSSLISQAKALTPGRRSHFFVCDAQKPFDDLSTTFSHAVMMLSLQNMADPKAVLHNIRQVLKGHGILIIVLNHPCFRIPKLSGWLIDAEKKLQSRRVDRYMTSMEIPIQAHPSQEEHSALSTSFHHPLSFYSKILNESGFSIHLIEEWCSDKRSVGSASKMENRARKEFPLFLAIIGSVQLESTSWCN